MTTLSANEIYSIYALSIDEARGQVEVRLGSQSESRMCKYFWKDGESDEEMRESGYVFIENGEEFDREIWISAEELQA